MMLRVEHDGKTYERRCVAKKRYAIARLDVGGREPQLIVELRTNDAQRAQRVLAHLMRTPFPRRAFLFDMPRDHVIERRNYA